MGYLKSPRIRHFRGLIGATAGVLLHPYDVGHQADSAADRHTPAPNQQCLIKRWRMS